MAILVGVKMDTRKAVRLNVTFPENVMEQIGHFAVTHSYTRPGFLARAANASWKKTIMERGLSLRKLKLPSNAKVRLNAGPFFITSAAPV